MHYSWSCHAKLGEKYTTKNGRKKSRKGLILIFPSAGISLWQRKRSPNTNGNKVGRKFEIIPPFAADLVATALWNWIQVKRLCKIQFPFEFSNKVLSFVIVKLRFMSVTKVQVLASLVSADDLSSCSVTIFLHLGKVFLGSWVNCVHLLTWVHIFKPNDNYSSFSIHRYSIFVWIVFDIHPLSYSFLKRT